MSAVIILLALSALIGFALGTWFLSSVVLQIQGFGALSGIAIVVACLTVNQLAYLAGVFYRSKGLFQKQVDEEPSQHRHDDIAGKRQQQKSPAWSASE